MTQNSIHPGPDQAVPVGRLIARPTICPQPNCGGMAGIVSALYVTGSEHIIFRCTVCNHRFSHHHTKANPDKYYDDRGVEFISRCNARLDEVNNLG